MGFFEYLGNFARKYLGIGRKVLRVEYKDGRRYNFALRNTPENKNKIRGLEKYVFNYNKKNMPQRIKDSILNYLSDADIHKLINTYKREDIKFDIESLVKNGEELSKKLKGEEGKDRGLLVTLLGIVHARAEYESKGRERYSSFNKYFSNEYIMRDSEHFDSGVLEKHGLIGQKTKEILQVKSAFERKPTIKETKQGTLNYKLKKPLESYSISQLYQIFSSDDVRLNVNSLVQNLANLEKITKVVLSGDNSERKKDLITLESLLRARIDYEEHMGEFAKFNDKLINGILMITNQFNGLGELLPGQTFVSESGAFYLESLQRYKIVSRYGTSAMIKAREKRVAPREPAEV